MQQRMSRKDIDRIRREFDLLLKDPDKYRKKHGFKSGYWDLEVVRLAKLLKGSGLSDKGAPRVRYQGLARGRTGRIPIVSGKGKRKVINT